MIRIQYLSVSLAALLALGTLALAPAFAQISAVPNSINFSGRLVTPSGNPVADGTYSVRFSLHDALTGGTEKWNKTVANVQVKNGTFAVTLDAFLAGTFNGNLWLEVKIGNDAALAPRTPLVSVPYAMKSDLALTVPDGSLTAAKFASGVLNANAWLLSGNSGVTTGFLGTTDTNPLTLKVNNRRVMQYTYFEDLSNANTDFQFRVSNLLGGSEVNSIAPGAYGATIVGGGQDYVTGFDNPNTVTDNFGTVVGGSLNQADGFSFVGGGYNNKATEFYSTIVGGTFNQATNNQTFIGGGISNTASSFGALVTGGQSNLASGQFATVPGGYDNTAAGNYSFAAGNRARANHAGTFVWADSTNADFASTGANQFLIRAAGGVGINTTSPAGNALNVNGSLRATSVSVGSNQAIGGFLSVSGNQSIGGSLTVGTSQSINGNLAIGGTLTVGNVPFGDYRNLQVNGNTGQLYYDNSSRKHKQNITPLVDDFEKLLQAVPMTYTRPAAPDRWEIGFIAEDFHELGLKRLVDYSDKGEVEGINYEKICLYLTAIAKKQSDRLNVQDKQQVADKAELAELRAELDALKAAVREIQNLRK